MKLQCVYAEEHQTKILDMIVIIPRNSIDVVGPACFSGARGAARSLHTNCSQYSHFPHCFNSGCPMIAKSPR